MIDSQTSNAITQQVVLQFKTRAVLVFATERKNNVDLRLRSQKKVKNVHDLLTEQGQQRSRVIR